MNMSMILRGFLRLGAVLMLSATLAACGGDDGDSDGGKDPGTGQPETPKPEPVKPELRCAP
ncbi:hypothetical protein FOC84_32440 [Achromobacter pestifer]|uniref:Lipoprotein n=1 Tax=Achromobacter pestifer TaxID=1353889 RepID=A0A7D4E1K7_9BURK|nr:hypothetical protein [Achromobacter pestifer]QKH39395.1 hypothetical protein FOC84_32440 [Achromobacter pestifer]